MQVIISVDIGTTGCRAAVFRPDAVQLAGSSAEYPLHTPEPAWAEQDPEEIYQAFVRTVNEVVAAARLSADDVAGLSFSSVFHSMVAVDAEGQALSRLLIWADTRAQKYTEKLKAERDGKAIYSRTGCPLHPMYWPSKILWMRQETPQVFARTAKFLSIKEYILYRLLGKFVVDRSIASGTGLYNFKTLSWDEELLAALGIGEDKLSQVLSTTHVERGLTPAAAAALGLKTGTAVVLGAGDGVMSAVGSGAVNPGQLTAMIGTSGAVRVVADKPGVDEQSRTWCYNLTDAYWVLGGAINNGGIVFRWVRDQLGAEERQEAARLGLDAYDLLCREAEKVPAGSGGLLCLPFFTGERAPYWNANARGVLFGLSINHERPHIVRAALEGVVFRMFSIFSALEEVSGAVTEIRASGSFTRSPLWLQIMADIFGRTITVPGEPEGSVFGAAVLGMSALGMLGDVREVTRFINIKDRYQPVAANHERYQALYAIYQRVYWNLQQEFSAITDLQLAWSKH
jgi:gluconokinase